MRIPTAALGQCWRFPTDFGGAALPSQRSLSFFFAGVDWSTWFPPELLNIPCLMDYYRELYYHGLWGIVITCYNPS